MWYFISYIKPNSVYIKFSNPFLADFTEILYHFFLIRIQLWHCICKCKRIKTPVSGVCSFSNLLPVFHHKPVRITRIFSMFQYIKPRRKFPSTVVKYGIYHNADSFFMCFLAKHSHRFFITERWIDLCIIRSVIFVIWLCFHDWIQINPGNSKVLKIR